MTTKKEIFGSYPLLHGFLEGFPWDMNVSSNPYYSPLYYILCRGLIAKNILEIGLDAGYSSYMLGIAAKENGGKFFGVDKHRLKAERIKKKMDELEIPNTIIWADSNDIEKWTWCDRLSFILLDGNHNVKTIIHEMDILYPILLNGGIICIHDVWAWSAEGWARVMEKFGSAEHLSLSYNYGLGIIKKKYEKEGEKRQQVINNHQEWQIADWKRVEATRTGEVIEL